MKRQQRTASLRLVLEDRRVDEILARLKEVDSVLVETEDRLGRISDRLAAVSARLLDSRQPSLPGTERDPSCEKAHPGLSDCRAR